MIRIIEFKAKDSHTKKWETGDLLHMNNEVVIVNSSGTHSIYEETICQNSGTLCYAERAVFEHDILFEEIEDEFGDSRTYYVVTYIQEWGCFALLDFYEHSDYIMNGVEYFSDAYEYSMDGVESMHYAGNYFDNKDILLASVNENDININLD